MRKDSKPNLGQSPRTPEQIRLKRAKAAAFLLHNRGKSQYRHAPSAGQVTGKVLRPLTKKFGPGTRQLSEHWEQIVGPRYASLSKPVSLRKHKDGNILTIIANGPAATLLAANSAQLIAKINKFLGQGAVAIIRVKQGKIGDHLLASNTNAGERAGNETQSAIKIAVQLQSPLEDNAENALDLALEKLGNQIAKTQK